MKTIYPSSTIKSLLRAVAVALALCLASPGIVRAAYFRIFDSNPDDSMMTIQVTDFEEGFLLNDNLIQFGMGTATVTLADSAGSANFQASWLSEEAFPAGERTLYVLQEPDGLVGAILHYSWFSEDGIGTIMGTFQSDSDAQPDLGPLPADAYPTDVFVENHIEIPISQPSLPSLDAVLVTEPVPEPGTFSLLFLGLLGVAGVRRRGTRG